MTLRKRIIACLDVTNGRVVKGTRFVDLVDAGDPVELAARYGAEGADEITILDIGATVDARPALLELISRAATALDVPLAVGGGVRSVDDAAALLDAGADKIAVNSAALRDPALVGRLADRLGSQSVVVAIDAARVGRITPGACGPSPPPRRRDATPLNGRARRSSVAPASSW